MTEDAIADLLAAKHGLPQWAFLRAVRNATGFPAQLRTADAMAVSLWPSRGIEVWGFEIKCERRDWLNELKRPEKAEAICQFCDRWWIVTPEKVVLEKDLPKTWGWMEVVKNRLKVRKPAPELKPRALTSVFLASLVRAAISQVSPEAQKKEAFNRGVVEGRRQAEDNAVNELKRLRQSNESWERVAEDFRRKSGVYICQYSNGSEIGEAVRQVLNGDHTKIDQRLRRQLQMAKDIVSAIEDRLKADTPVQDFP